MVPFKLCKLTFDFPEPLFKMMFMASEVGFGKQLRIELMGFIFMNGSIDGRRIVEKIPKQLRSIYYMIDTIWELVIQIFNKCENIRSTGNTRLTGIE